MPPDDTAPRAFVLGLDGVPWEFIRDHATRGTLPNFARLFEEGGTGPLESTTPATTPLAWPSIATGVRPDKHGIYGFQKLTGKYHQEMYTSDDRRQSPLWEILSPALVGNVPMTYPATPIDGKMITGMTTPKLEEGATHPPHFREKLLDRVPDYRVGLDWSDYTDSPDELVEDLSEMVERRRKAMRLLMEDGSWRLFFFVYTAPDRLQHLIWEERVLLDHYRTIDEILGEVMAYVAENDATLYVVSDHGFGPISKYVSVNRVLEEEGLLTRAGSESSSGRGPRLVPNRETVERLIEAVGIDAEDLKSIVPDVLYQRMTSKLSGRSLLYDTDFGRTRAFVFGPGNVYVNDAERFENGSVDPEDREEVKAVVRSVLEALEDPETGASPVTVHDGADLFPTDEGAPDLVVDKVNGYECKTGLHDSVFRDPGEKAGNHRSTGMFAAWGPAIEAGSSVEDATVYDVAPTILHAMGEPIPAETDGRLLVELLEDAVADREPERASYAVDAGETDRDEDYSEVHERLQGLGYLE